MALLSKYGYSKDEAPPGARLMQLRMFYLPDEPAGPLADEAAAPLPDGAAGPVPGP
jgi:hypothetical protein